MKKAFLSIFLFYVGISYSIAQWKTPSMSIPTPNASSLGQYGEIPVSMFTGVPSISIPLYEVAGNKISLPISISYHAAGLKPDVHPGWVGSGFNLNAGGAITRVLKKAPDEASNSTFGGVGYLFNYYRLAVTDWNDYLRLKSWGGYPLNVDVEPDEFLFNFLDYSGKFFLDQNGQWRVQCSKPVVVLFDQGDLIDPFILTSNPNPYYPNPDFVSKAFAKFTIIDEFGNKYTFGGTDESAIEYSENLASGSANPVHPPNPNNRMGENFYATSWHLTKIESADGTEVINLAYERGPYTSFLFREYTSMQMSGYPGGPWDLPCSQYNGSPSTAGRITSPVYLTEITMPSKNVKINFTKSASSELTYTNLNYDAVKTSAYGSTSVVEAFPLTDYAQGAVYFPGGHYPGNQDLYQRFLWLKLNDIAITRITDNQLVKKVSFNYTDISTKRLQLNSIALKGNQSQTIQNYQFEYDPLPLPNYLTVMGDHWGFYSYATHPPGINSYNFETLREPNGGTLQAEILKKVIYPTGGSTQFEYEIGDCSAYVERNGAPNVTITPTNRQVGGLRVKKITSTDPVTNTSFYKEYFYVKNYTYNSIISTLQSSGVLDSKPVYSFTLNGVDVANVGFLQSITTSNPVVPLTFNSTGSHIGYSEVVERRSDGAYTIYKYTNHDNGYSDVPPVTPFNRSPGSFIPYSTREFERGQLTSKIDFTSSGQYVSEKQIEYNRVNPTGKEARAIDQNFFRIGPCQTATRQAVSRGAYLLYYYKFVPTQVIEKLYPNSGSGQPITVTKNYTYDDYGNVLTETVTGSTSDVTKTYFSYPAQFGSTFGGLLGENRVSELIEKRTTTLKNGQEYLTSGELNIYGGFIVANNSAFLKQKTYVFESSQPVLLSTVTPTTFNGTVPFDARYNSSQPAVVFDYDENGNPSSIKAFDIPEKYLWGSHYRSPIAKINNTSDIACSYTSFEDYDMGTWSYNINPPRVQEGITGKQSYQLSNGPITKAQLTLATSYIVSYWIKPGASVSVTGTQSTTTGVMRNGWQYVEKIISGIPSVTISGTGIIDEVRLYPKNGQMVTYTYEPLVGITSMCDANNNITYYEYDVFNRLKNARDFNKNIIQNYCYNYAGTPTPCNPSGLICNQAVSQTYTKVCSNPNESGTQVTYTIPAGKYCFATQAEVDNAIQNDFNTNGQTYANTNGTCRQTTCTTGNCNGFDLKCINGYCERALKKRIGWYYCSATGGFIVTHRYTWSDGTYIDITSGPPCQIPME